jgi:hypothetical protein
MKLPDELNHDRIVCALPKAIWADLFWRCNATGCVRDSRPQSPTVNGEIVGDDLAGHLDQFPGETMRQRAERRGLIDVWTPVFMVQFSASQTLRYTGKKALSIWEAWRAMQFGKKNKRKTD